MTASGSVRATSALDELRDALDISQHTVRELKRHRELQEFGARLYRTLAQVTRRKIESFRELEAGWCYGEGVAFDEKMLEVALKFNRFAAAQGFAETDAFPGTEGEIMYTVYLGEHYLEFTINPPDGSVDYLREWGDEEVESEEGLSLSDAEEKVSEFKDELCDSFDIFTASTMTIEKDASKVLLSSHPAMVPGYRWFMSNVSTRPETPFADMPRSTTRPSRANR